MCMKIVITPRNKKIKILNYQKMKIGCVKNVSISKEIDYKIKAKKFSVVFVPMTKEYLK